MSRLRKNPRVYLKKYRPFDEPEKPARVETAVTERDSEADQAEVSPEPANDEGKPIEPTKVHARGPSNEERDAETAPTATYVKADPASVATPDRDRFYDVGYRGKLHSMVDHVIEIDGPPTGLEEDEDIIRGMQEHFGLGLLAASTRERFEAAANQPYVGSRELPVRLVLEGQEAGRRSSAGNQRFTGPTYRLRGPAVKGTGSPSSQNRASAGRLD